MTKEEFLNKLRNKLSVLDEKEVDDIIEEYSEHIDEKVKNKVKEEKAIEELGDVDSIANEILDAYKVNKKYKSNNEIPFINNLVEETKSVFDKIGKIISKGTSNDIFKLLVYLLLIFIIIGLMKIPFELLDRGVENIFGQLPDVVYNPLCIVINVFMNLSYIVVAFIVLIKLLNERLLDNISVFNNEEVKEETKKTKKDTKSEGKSETKSESKNSSEKQIVYRNNRTFLDSLADIVLFMIRFFMVFLLIPAMCSVLGFAVAFAVVLVFAIKYVFIIGPAIICLALLVGSIWFSELLFRFILKKDSSFTKMFITFIIAVVLFGAGVGISAIEVTSFKIEDYNGEKVLITEETYKEFSGNVIECYDCENATKKVNSEFKDNQLKITVYGQEYLDANVYVHGGYVHGILNEEDDENIAYNGYITINSHFSPEKIINGIVDNIKDKKVLNYYDEKSTLDIIVEGNSNTLEKVRIDY